MKQFTNTNCRYGAPMGRSSFGMAADQPDRSISLFRVKFVDGDYDDGGAYWGGGWACDPLYCARTDDGEFRRFVRATSRQKAITDFGIRHAQLKAGR